MLFVECGFSRLELEEGTAAARTQRVKLARGFSGRRRRVRTGGADVDMDAGLGVGVGAGLGTGEGAVEWSRGRML